MATCCYTGSSQYVTVAATGEYNITAYGAQGGAANLKGVPYSGGGGGAEIGGLFELTQGERLEIIVGGRGESSGFLGGGGGGGSFVLANNSGTYVPLIVAGGGGGGADRGYNPAFTTGGNGQGGTSAGQYSGGGGSGVKSAGGNSPNAQGGSNLLGGYAGGNGGYHNRNGSSGGFSGGYGGLGLLNAALAPYGVGGGGGSSYDSGTPVALNPAFNQGNGRVVIAPNVVCFASGTRIRTRRGEVAVEALQVGDLAILASGEHRPITWLGHRAVDCRCHPRRAEVLPVRIRAHAFGAGRPSRGLLVSAGHALCVDVHGEFLVPAFALITDKVIEQVDVASMIYWHVELDAHDILLAENLPVESYLDMGNRGFSLTALRLRSGLLPTLSAVPTPTSAAPSMRPAP